MSCPKGSLWLTADRRTFCGESARRQKSDEELNASESVFVGASRFVSELVKRAGRNMVSTKSPDRRLFGDDAFAILVWLSYNAPPTHQVDFRPIVLAWLRDGKHRKAEQENGNGSKVLQRLYEEKKCTILG